MKPMLNLPRPARRRLPMLALLGIVLVGAWAWQHYRVRRTIDLSGWDITRLVDHLHKRGLNLNSFATGGTAQVPESAYLSTAPIDLAARARLERSNERVADWRGVVQCQIIRDRDVLAEERKRLEDHYLERGPFFFFGDPKLLADIDNALREGD